MKNFLRVVAAVSVLTFAAGAYAADPVFPPGARVGLVPPDGVVTSKEFLGFESEDKSVKIGVAEIPPAAFAAVEVAFKEGKPMANGSKVEQFKTAAGDAYITMENRKEGDASYRTYSLIAPADKFSAYVIAQLREGAANVPSDDAIRKILATTTTRKDVPVEEQLSLLPFKVGELSNFKTVRTIAMRSTVLLTDGTDDTPLEGAPYMVIGTVAGGPASPEERERFAQQAATTIPGLREARITGNEPIRIDSTPGYETRIDAVAGKNDTPVTVVQWLRFGNGSTLRIIASSTREEWPKAFPRFRAVRDGLGPK